MSGDHRSIRSALAVLGLLAFFLPVATAQPWEHVRTVNLGGLPMNTHVSLALEGDMLVVSTSMDGGGAAYLLSRHQGGLDQWGAIGTVEGIGPWSAYSLAMRNGILAVGSPGASGAGAFSGAVDLFRIVPLDLLDPLQPMGSIVPPDAGGNERFGYALAWIGDTLLASTTDRSSFHMTGAVFLCADGPQGFGTIGMLPATSRDIQVPFTRWFGGAIATSRDHIAIAAPYSGFDIGYADQNIGAIHLFERDPSSAMGWALDTAWFDAALDGADPCRFERVELGREGLAFVGDQLIMDHSFRYTGTSGTALDYWQAHHPDPVGCPECGLRVVEHGSSSWDFAGSYAPTPVGPTFQRGAQGWCSDGEFLYVEWYDPLSSSWRTSVHAADQGGPGQWGVVAEIPEQEGCDDLRGPIVVSGDHLVRTSLRRGSECGVPDGSIQMDLQIFHR